MTMEILQRRCLSAARITTSSALDQRTHTDRNTAMPRADVMLANSPAQSERSMNASKDLSLSLTHSVRLRYLPTRPGLLLSPVNPPVACPCGRPSVYGCVSCCEPCAACPVHACVPVSLLSLSSHNVLQCGSACLLLPAYTGLQSALQYRVV